MGAARITDVSQYDAHRLVVASGPWISQFIPELAGLALPERQVVAWFETLNPGVFSTGRFPVFNMMIKEGRYYGFPEFGVPGFKIGRYHHRNERVNPDQMDRACDAGDERILRDCVEKYFPDAAGPALSMRTCIFTNSPDGHFLLGIHPRCPQVVICSPCSGHGFKFSPVIGEIVADLCQRGDTAHDIALHRLDRFPEFSS